METTIAIPDNIQVTDPEYTESVLSFAQTRPVGEFETLQRSLDQISRIAGQSGRAELYKDFAPYSFTWRAGGLFGGLIYHGSHDGGGDGGAPTFSVCLERTTGWRLHT